MVVFFVTISFLVLTLNVCACVSVFEDDNVFVFVRGLSLCLELDIEDYRPSNH